ncbi:YkuD_like domain containing protein [Rhabdaerophilaceae bacterium]
MPLALRLLLPIFAVFVGLSVLPHLSDTAQAASPLLVFPSESPAYRSDSFDSRFMQPRYQTPRRAKSTKAKRQRTRPAPQLLDIGQIDRPPVTRPAQRRAASKAAKSRQQVRRVEAMHQRKVETRRVKQRQTASRRALQARRAAAAAAFPATDQASLGDVARQHRIQPEASGPVEAHINIRTQTMTVKVDGEVRHVWKVSTGRSGYATPRGTYGPQRMHQTYFSRKYYNSPMPYSIFFRGGYAIHGTNAVNRLGGPASHGCVRLAIGNARTLFQLVKRNGTNRTRIVIT